MTLITTEVSPSEQSIITMELSQIQTLIAKSKRHFKKRQLKKALNAAQIAFDFARNKDTSTPEVWELRLLLANIYYTNAKYQNDFSFFLKAITFLEEQLTEGTFTDQLAANLTLAKIYQSIEKPEKAKHFIEESFKKSQQNSSFEGIVRSLLGFSQNAILERNFEEAVKFAVDGYKFMQKSNVDPKRALELEVYLQLSECYIWLKDFAKAIQVSQKLLDLSRIAHDLEKEVIALKNMALVCGMKSNYKIGLQYFLEALDKSEQIGFRPQIAQILVNIGTIYAHLYSYQEAINRYQQVLEDYDDILSEENKVAIYNNIGNIHYTTEKPKRARGYFLKAYQIAFDKQYEGMLAHTLAQLARTALQIADFPAATKYAEQAEILFDKTGETNGQQIHLLNLAILEANQNDYQAAINLTKSSIDLAKKIQDNAGEINAYKLLADFYKQTGNYKEALDYQIIYSKSQENFARLQRDRQFLNMEIRHAIREKQREIEQLTKENDYQSLLLDKTDQIARQNQELIRANGELRQFAYIASHDLKEPLRMIGAYAKIVKKGIQPYLDEKHSTYFSYITDGVDRMNALLDALLQYATVGNSGEQQVSINLNNIIELVQYNLKISIEEQQAEIHVEQLPEVNGLKTMFLQLFQNLISNAIKFRKADQHPIIHIKSTEQDDNFIITIADNGIGISKTDQQSVFEIFQRLHPKTAYEGTGIGLAICKKIVDGLGGKIWLESEKGIGTTFYFSLPKQESPLT